MVDLNTRNNEPVDHTNYLQKEQQQLHTFVLDYVRTSGFTEFPIHRLIETAKGE